MKSMGPSSQKRLDGRRNFWVPKDTEELVPR